MKNFLFRFSMDHPKLIISLTAIITVIFLFQFPKIHVDTDPENMLNAHDRVRRFHHEMKERFNLHDMLVLGIYHENGVFNETTIPRIIDITNDIKELDGVLVDDILALSEVDDISNTESGTIRVHPLVEKIPESKEDGLDLKFSIERNPILSNKLASLDGKLVGIYIPIKDKSTSFILSQQIEQIAKKHLGDEEYHIAGLPIAEDTFGVQMFKQMGVSAPLAGLIIALLLLFFFRKFRVILAPILLAIVTIIWTMGLLIGTGNTVHIMSSMIPIFLFPIAVLNSIHILSSYHERYQKYKHLRTTIFHTMEELFSPMLFTSLTTTVGFASLALTPIPPVRVFGLFVSFGIAVAWLLSMTFLPAYSMILSKNTLKNFGVSEDGDKSLLARFLPVLQRWSMTNARLILAGTAILLVISGIGISMIVVNDNPVNWFKPDHPLRKADVLMNNHMGGTYMSNIVFEGEDGTFKDPKVVSYLENIQKMIDGQPSVGATTSVADVLKKISYELKGESAVPDNEAEIAQYYFIYEMAGGDPDDLFTFITPEYNSAHIWIHMTRGDNVLMSALVANVNKYIEKNPLPSGLRVEWAGLNYINMIWQEKMVHGMIWSLLGSFGVVFLMMIFLFRSLTWGLLSMVPLTTTITFIYALIGFTGKPYDMPVAVLSSLTLGLSIDFAIHFIKRAQYIHKTTGDFSETMRLMFQEPAKAITRNMLVIAIGFVPLFFATLVPYLTVGVFFFIIMLFSGIATLIILPALSTVLKERLFPQFTHETEKKETKMKNIVSVTASIIAALLISAASFNTALAADENDPIDPQEIMKQSHLHYYYAANDGFAEVEMSLINAKGKTRTRKFNMVRKDFEEGGEQRYFIYFKEPNDVRRMTFMVWKFQNKDDARWMYIPALDLVKPIAANDKKSSFVGSDFTHEDVSGRHWTEDTHELEKEDVYNGRPVYVIKSVPKDPKGANFSYKRSFIDKETYLPLHEEYYDSKNNLDKVFEADGLKEIDGVYTITKRTMIDKVKNHKTIVTFSDIRYNVNIKDNIFSEKFLRKPPREYVR